MKIYFGWNIVLLVVFVHALVIGTFLQSFGLFVIPVTEDLGISRANMNTAFVIANLGNAFIAPVVGRLVDIFPARSILAISSIVLGFGIATLGMASDLWVMMFCFLILIPAGMNGTSTITGNALVARWFSKLRTRAMAIAALGVSVGGVVVPPVLAFLIDSSGWKMAVIVAGAVITACLLSVSFFIRERPGEDDVEPGTQSGALDETRVEASQPAMGFIEMLRKRRFWLLVLPAAILSGMTTTLLVSFVPIGVAAGLSAVQAASLISAASAAGIVTKLVLAYYGDRLDTLLIFMVIGMSILLVGIGLLVGSSYASLICCAIVMGFAYGALIPVLQVLMLDVLGINSFGTARGLLGPISAVLNMICVRGAGEIYDRTGAYHHVFISLIILSLVALSLMVMLRNHMTSRAPCLSGDGPGLDISQ